MKVFGFEIARAASALPLPSPEATQASPEAVGTALALAKAMSPWLVREVTAGRVAAARSSESGEGLGRLPFTHLRYLADNADLVRMGIDGVRSAILAQDWTLFDEEGGDVPPEADALLKRPDGDLEWDQWAGQALEEILVCDNLCVFPWYKGGKLVRAEIVDGDTISPKPDRSGRLPQPPGIAFEQWSPDGLKTFTLDTLWYLPQYRRTKGHRGFSAVERIASRAAVNLWKEMKDLARWQAGGVPPALLPAPDGMSPEEAEVWQRKLDLLAEGRKYEHSLRVIPPGGKAILLQPPKFDKEHEEILIRSIFRAFGVDPTSMVSQVNYTTADALSRWQALSGVRPWLWALKSIAERILTAAGWPGLRLNWKAEQDARQQTEQEGRKVMFRSGLLSWEEAREAEGLPTEESEIGEMHFFAEGSLSPLDPLAEELPQPEFSDPQGWPPGQGQEGKPGQQEEKEPPPPEVKKAEVERWRTVVRKALSAGKAPRPFRSSVLGRAYLYRVGSALEAGMGMESFAKARPRRGEVDTWESSRRTKRPHAALQEAVRPYLDKVHAALLREAEKALSSVEKLSALPPYLPAPSRETWRDFVAALRALYEAGVDDGGELVGYGRLSAGTAQAYAETRAGLLIGRRWSDVLGQWMEVPNSSYRITETLRAEVSDAVARAIREGTGYAELRAALTQSFDSTARSLTVARTETAQAYNEGACANYGAQGVEVVEVMDGNGPGACEECDKANGAIWSLSYALQNPTEHPNCVRGFVPRPDLSVTDTER